MNALKMFLPITKVDAETRTVYGVATAESMDLSGEVCDYESTKPLYQKWSNDFHVASGGKSMGNLRAMHGKIAAGKLTAINFDDAGKRIEIAAKVVDDGEWQKVQEGVYTGFSQGGRYIKRWREGDVEKYTAEPHEVSLVDLPCLPTATFQMIKGAHVETRKFAHPFDAEPDVIKAKAVELAKAKGGKAEWTAFADAALDALAKDAAKAAIDAIAPLDPGSEPLTAAIDFVTDEEVNEADPQPPGKDKEARPGERSRKVYEPAQFWACACADHKHEKKADAIKCLKATDDEAIAKAAAADPLQAKLDKIDALLDGVAPMAADASTPAEKIKAALEALFPVEKKAWNADDRKAAAKSGEAMSDGSFPIADRADLENAVKAFGRAKDKVAAKKHIEERARALGCTDCLPSEWAVQGAPSGATAAKDAAAGDDLKKDFNSVSSMANAVQAMSWVYREALWDRMYSDAASASSSDNLCHLLRQAGEVLLTMVSEAVAAVMPDGAGPLDDMDGDEMAMAAGSQAGIDALAKLADLPAFAMLAKFKTVDVLDLFPAELKKAGARNSKADATRIQGIHDSCMALGAGCSSDNCGKSATGEDDLAKVKDEKIASLEKRISDADTRFEGVLAKLTERLAKMEARPAPAKAAITAVTKGVGVDDSTGGTGATDAQADLLAQFEKMKPEERALLMMKMSLKNPVAVVR